MVYNEVDLINKLDVITLHLKNNYNPSDTVSLFDCDIIYRKSLSKIVNHNNKFEIWINRANDNVEYTVFCKIKGDTYFISRDNKDNPLPLRLDKIFINLQKIKLPEDITLTLNNF